MIHTSPAPQRPRPTPIDPAALPRRALCVATTSAEAMRACRRALEIHTAREDAVRVVIVCGDSGESAPLARDVRFLKLAPADLGASTEIVARLKSEIADFAPELVYGPTGLCADLAQRATAAALASALAGGAERRVLLYPAASEGADGGERFENVSSRDVLELWRSAARVPGLPQTTAVVSTWNKRDDVRANLDGLRSQTLPFAEIVVVDNASSDGTAKMIAAEFPEVRLVVMPHSAYGACETFNIGFATSQTEYTAILDDDIVMPPDWLEKSTRRLHAEPPTTAIVSTQVIEPQMPQSYKDSPLVNTERYMSTFRGCASLARADALRKARYYDERLFIYGNERDLTCRLLNLGYRVLQFPGAGVFHKTPFGIKMGKRSLYYHARNAWLSMLKYAPASDLLRMPWLVFSNVVLRGSAKEAEGTVTDAVGTIGIGRSLRETPGAWLVVTKAAFSVLYNVPYCLKHREPVRAPDFELPLH
jgi:GT2 family glycosyltransferase